MTCVFATRAGAAILTGCLGLAGFAQSGTDDRGAVNTTCSESHGDLFGYRSGAPFSAAWTQTEEKRRPDGTLSKQVSTTKVSRDAAGRTYFEEHGWLNGEPAPAGFWVYDPIKRIDIFWDGAEKVAHVVHLSDPDTPEYKERLRTYPWQKTLWAEPLCVDWGPDGQYQGGVFDLERLGTKTFFGAGSDGIRATRVLPAGYQGNAESVAVTEERWYSDDLQLALSSVVEDPRFGSNAWKINSLERSEPSSELFRPPADYAIVDEHPNQREYASASVPRGKKP